MTPLQSVSTRWDATIARIHQQFEQVLNEAWHASAPMVADTQLDLVPLTRVWGAVEHQLSLHTTRVSDAWDEISDALSAIDGLPEGLMWHEGSKRDVANRELGLRHTQYYRTLMAQAAEHMRQYASRCGTDDARRMFAASGARCLAEAAALDAYEAMVRAELVIDGHRERKAVPLEALLSFEECARRYWSCVFETEARYVPEQATYVAAKIERHMHDVRRKLAQYWQWRQRAAAG